MSETRVIALPDLSKLTALIYLRLRGTAIDEIPGIENLDALTKLDIRDTRIPPAYVEALRERLPNCDIYYP